MAYDAASESMSNVKAPQNDPDASKQFKTEAAAFHAWIRQYQPMWDHVSVLGLAAKVKSKWVNLCSSIVLTDTSIAELDASGACLVGTEELAVFRDTHPLTELPSILHEVKNGRISKRHVRSLGAPLLIQAPIGKPYRVSNGYGHYLQESGGGPPLQRLVRYEFNFYGDEYSKILPYNELSRRSRVFEGLGRGPLAEFLYGRSIRQNTSDFQWNENTSVRVIAPVSLQIVAAEQGAERRALRVRVEAGSLVPRERIGVAFRHEDDSVPPLRVSLHGSSRVVDLEIPDPPHGDGVVAITLNGEMMRTRKVRILPPLVPNALLIAGDLMEPGLKLLKAGLLATHSEPYERSICHLLAAVGLRMLWWGPNRVPSLPLPPPSPDGTSDLVALSRKGRIAFVIECTIRQPGTEKVTKLAGRCLRLQSCLDARLGSDSPRVRGMLALPLPTGEISTAVRRAAELDGLALLTREPAQALLDAMLRGFSQPEIDRRFASLFPRRRDGEPSEDESS